MSQARESLVVDRLLEPVGRILTPEVARQLVALRADPAMQERIDLLADKRTGGRLTPEERTEYETYVRFIDFLAILQAKARRRLADEAPA